MIGAGITGVTTAYELIKAGYQVCLFDKHPYPAMETSFANGGQLSASNAEVWNQWSTIGKGIKWMFTPGAPLLVNPAPSWHKMSWMAEFLLAIPKYEDNTIATAKLALQSRKRLKEVAEAEGIVFDCENRGILHFYKSKAEFDQAARVTKILNVAGLTRHAVTPEEIRKIEPTLHDEFYGGFYTESDFTGDVHKFTNGLAKACQLLGLIEMLETEVIDIDARADGVRIGYRFSNVNAGPDTETRQRNFDGVVICGGVYSRRLAAMAGDRINVYPVKGYSITVNLIEEEAKHAAPWISLLDDEAKIVTSRLGADRFRVAGTAEFNGFNRNISAARIDPLIDWCREHFPAMSTRQCVPWSGLRPMMPDMQPRVQRGKRPGVFYNTGHGHLGWTLSAATAALTAALIATK